MSTITPLVAMILLLGGCARQQSASLEEPLALFRENNLEQALPAFKKVVAQQKNNTEAHIWLAETYRRLGLKDEAVATVQIALDLDPCNSFAHTVMANANWPPPEDVELPETHPNWIHLNRAVQCDSTNGNAWISIWSEAIRRGKFGMARKSIKKMVETGFLTKTALAYGRWILRTLPEDAILITNGDMDTFPALALQVTEDFRPDVAIIERGLLNVTWGIRFFRDQFDVPLPFQDSELDSLKKMEDEQGNTIYVADQVFNGWVAQVKNSSFPRPIAITVTVEESFYLEVKDHLEYAGSHRLLHPTPVNNHLNMTALDSSLTGIKPKDFTGSWVSEQDYSPIRGLYTKYIVQNITEAALVYAKELLKGKKYTETEEILSWAEGFERGTELGPVFTEQINMLRKKAKMMQIDH